MRLKALATVVMMMYAVSWATRVQAQTSADLVSALSKELGSSTQQAEGAAGSLFGYAKGKLKPEDWTKIASAVPGMDGLLKAAPASASPVGTTGVPGVDAVASKAGGISSLAGSFSKLGLKPEMIAKATPILTQFVTKTGGADVGKLLAGALK